MTDRPQRVLAISSFFPLPADRGDPLRVGMYLRALDAISDLTVYAVRRADTVPTLVGELEAQLGKASIITFAPPDLSTSRIAKIRRWIRAVVAGIPVWILNRYSSELDALLQSTAHEFDVIVFLGDAAGIYSLTSQSHWKHLDKSNVMSRSTAHEAALATNLRLKARLTAIAWLSRRFERRVLGTVHTVGVTSLEEAARLEADYMRTANVILPSAIELTPHPGPFDPCGSYVVWLGSLEYRSNVAGLERFLAEGLPVLRNAGLNLVVAGSGHMPRIAARLEATPGVDYRGYVPDLACLAAAARAAVVPLWTGAGVKLKTLTLMDLGLPIAATPVAMEGIDVASALVVSGDCRVLAERIVAASARELVAARERGLAAVHEGFSSESFDSLVAASLGHEALETTPRTSR